MMLVMMQDRYAHDNTLDENVKRYLSARANGDKEFDRLLISLLTYVEQLSLQIGVLQSDIKTLKASGAKLDSDTKVRKTKKR